MKKDILDYFNQYYESEDDYIEPDVEFDREQDIAFMENEAYLHGIFF